MMYKTTTQLIIQIIQNYQVKRLSIEHYTPPSYKTK